MNNKQYARIGKITPVNIYMVSSEMKDSSVAVKDHLAKPVENLMK